MEGRKDGRWPGGKIPLPATSVVEVGPSVLPSFRPLSYRIANFSGNCLAIAPASGSAIIRMWAAASRSLA